MTKGLERLKDKTKYKYGNTQAGQKVSDYTDIQMFPYRCPLF